MSDDSTLMFGQGVSPSCNILVDMPVSSLNSHLCKSSHTEKCKAGRGKTHPGQAYSQADLVSEYSTHGPRIGLASFSCCPVMSVCT